MPTAHTACLLLFALVAPKAGYLEESGPSLFALDFEKQGKALVASDGYAIYASPKIGKGLGRAALRLRVSGAGTGNAKLGARVQCLDAHGKKLGAHSVGLWNAALKDSFSRFELEFTLEHEATDSFRVFVYRSNKQGTLRLGSVMVERVPQFDAADLVAEIEKRLKKQGYSTAYEPGYLVGSKPDERAYYHTFAGRKLSRLKFDQSVYAGTTWVRNDIKPSLFPVGVYFYGAADHHAQLAERRGMKLADWFDFCMKDMAAHGCNTVYVANIANKPDDFRLVTGIAQKHGLGVFGQLTRDLYLRPGKGRKHYDEVTVPTAKRILPGYRGLKGLLTWMPKEEAAPKEVPQLQEYRKLVRQLDPTHAIYTLHNNIGTFRADDKELPEWFGFDRYRFRSLFGSYGILISTPKDAAIRLREDIADFYIEAAKRGRPMIYVLQGGGWDWKGSEEKLLKELTSGVRPGENSGWQEIEPGIWFGWPRYLVPKYGMKLQCWLSVLEGAKGLHIYHYLGRGDELGKRQFGVVGQLREETPRWREFADTVAEIKPFVPTILRWHKEAVCPVQANHPEVFVRSFIFNFESERYVVAVNSRIAEWDKVSPRMPRGKTELKFTEKGLEGLRPVGPLTVKLKLTGPGRLFEFGADNPLPTEDGSFDVTIPPGGGKVFILK